MFAEREAIKQAKKKNIWSVRSKEDMDLEITLFIANSGLQVDILNKLHVMDFLALFLTNKLYRLISEQANLYAA